MRIVVLSELNLDGGSGYTTIGRAVAAGLGARGHDVKVLAFNYRGTEHRLPITVLGADERFLVPHIRQLGLAWGIEVVIAIADITKHLEWRPVMDAGYPYVGIFPLESEPLIHPSEWTRTIDGMAAALVETEWATRLCVDVGLAARHIPIGIDSAFWRPPTPEDRDKMRDKLGVAERYVLLTVSDNHERKNLPAVFATAAFLRGREFAWPPGSAEAVCLPVGSSEDYYLIVNTKRRPEAVGYHLWDLANRFQLQNDTTFYQHERRAGLSDEELRNLYWAADCFVLLSKAEGLGLPVMEAMACGLPCVCTDAGGMAENLADGRGWLIAPEYTYLDPFCNQVRRFADPYQAAKAVVELRARPEERERRIGTALAWAAGRSWDKALDVVEEALDGLKAKKEQAAGAVPPAGAYASPIAGGHPSTR